MPKSWFDDGRATLSINTIFAQQVFDKNGQLAPDRHRFEAAKLGFCITPLKLTGLVHEPVYLIEVVNTQLPGPRTSACATSAITLAAVIFGWRVQSPRSSSSASWLARRLSQPPR